MHIKKNVGTLDSIVRIGLAELSAIGSFFWLGGILQVVGFVVSAVLVLTAVVGFCGLYTVFGVNTKRHEDRPLSKNMRGLIVLIFLVLGIVLSYGSHSLTKKFFLEDYNAMNQFYKQTLFHTGKGEREVSIQNYEQLVAHYALFREKYQGYHPYVVAHDQKFNEDLDRIALLINIPKDEIDSGDLASAHLHLEQIRPVFQDILKRNGFSMLAVALVDFHDSMEKIIAASDAHDSALVLSTYVEVDAKLRDVEASANDLEIQSIRRNLEELRALADKGEGEALSGKAAELKSSFVKVYLTRG